MMRKEVRNACEGNFLIKKTEINQINLINVEKESSNVVMLSYSFAMYVPCPDEEGSQFEAGDINVSAEEKHRIKSWKSKEL